MRLPSGNGALRPGWRPSDQREQLWCLRKGAGVAEANVYQLGRGQQLCLEVDGAVVFSCLFSLMDGTDQLHALAASARTELEERGWREAAEAAAEQPST